MESTSVIESFNSFLKSATPGQRYVYYTGETLTFSILSNEIRKATWKAACEGYCYLVQKKLKVGLYEFWAVKASNPPNPKLVPIPERTEKNSIRLQSYTNRRVNLMERVMS